MANPLPFPPSANDIPIIGQPRIIGQFITALLLCSCENKTPMMVQTNAQGVCGHCRAIWALQPKGSLTPVRVGTLGDDGQVQPDQPSPAGPPN